MHLDNHDFVSNFFKLDKCIHYLTFDKPLTFLPVHP